MYKKTMYLDKKKRNRVNKKGTGRTQAEVEKQQRKTTRTN